MIPYSRSSYVLGKLPLTFNIQLDISLLVRNGHTLSDIEI